MLPIVDDVSYIDLNYLGTPRLIAAGVIGTDDGLLVVDPGPTTSLDALRIALEDRGGLGAIHAILLTHIHLDHAGATGSIVAEQPDVQVYVHRAGAPHIKQPERLLASARRLYGDMMDSLWGDFLAVPEGNVQVLRGDETLKVGGRTLEVAYTPGHAVHHVSYLDAATGTAFVGDTAGMRVAGVDYVMPVTPPPDVDVEAWHDSLDTLRDWSPERLFVTHFGPSDDVRRHLEEMRQSLDAWSEDVRASLTEDRDAGALAAAFQATKLDAMKRRVPNDAHVPYEQFGQPQASWYGLARYWKKRQRRAS